MFMGLTAPFAEGDKIDATLVFEKAGEVEVHFNVEARTRRPEPEGTRSRRLALEPGATRRGRRRRRRR